MPEIVTLHKGTLTAEVSTDGAWLQSLKDGDEPLLAPRQNLPAANGYVKERGGCHVCLPNFGPGGAGGQPQHGYGRNVEWQIAEISEAKDSVSLHLEQGAGDYEALSSTLSYQLSAVGIAMQLTLRNQGTEPLAVSPGFHPYFNTGDQTTVEVAGATCDLDELSEAVFLDESDPSLGIGNKMYDFKTEHLPAWVLWTDRLGKYVCLEPTDSGMSFESGAAPQLAAGETATYLFSITANQQ